jgi:hypothetical protein
VHALRVPPPVEQVEHVPVHELLSAKKPAGQGSQDVNGAGPMGAQLRRMPPLAEQVLQDALHAVVAA